MSNSSCCSNVVESIATVGLVTVLLVGGAICANFSSSELDRRFNDDMFGDSDDDEEEELDMMASEQPPTRA